MIGALVRVCVQKRFAAVLMTLLVAAYGLLAYFKTPIEAYPDVTNVQVNVVAQMSGLAPEEIERQVTIPLERALNGTPSMIQMRSESLFGLSIIWCVFEDGADAFKARTRVSERLLNAELPEGAEARVAPDATPLGKVYYYRLVSDRHTLYDLRSEQEWVVARTLKQVPGVADVVGMGGYLKELHVEVDPARMAAYDLTLGDITAALERSNQNVGGGFQPHGDQQLVIRGIGYLRSAQDLEDVVLESEGGTPVTLADVARTVFKGQRPPTSGMSIFETERAEATEAEGAALSAAYLPGRLNTAADGLSRAGVAVAGWGARLPGRSTGFQGAPDVQFLDKMGETLRVKVIVSYQKCTECCRQILPGD